METRDEKGRVARAVVAYALGSGEHGVTMVTRDEPAGTHRQSRISYYTAERAWRETKGVNMLPHDPSDFIGLELSEKSLRQCLQCHTTWFRAALPIPTVPGGPESADRGIGCERCHGPGLNHVKAVEAGFEDLAIGAARTRRPAGSCGPCNECHASSGAVEPSDPEFTRVQGTTLMFSRCFTATGGASTAPPATTRIAASTRRRPITSRSASPATTRRPPGAARPADLPRQPVLGLHRLPHAQGAGPEPQDAVHRPPHPRPSPARGRPGRRRMTT